MYLMEGFTLSVYCYAPSNDLFKPKFATFTCLVKYILIFQYVFMRLLITNTWIVELSTNIPEKPALHLSTLIIPLPLIWQAIILRPLNYGIHKSDRFPVLLKFPGSWYQNTVRKKTKDIILIEVRCSQNVPQNFPQNSSRPKGPLGGPEGPN